MAVESTNTVKITGKLVEINHREGVDKNGKEYLAGTAKIKVGEDTILPVDFYQKKVTNAGGENGFYKGLVTAVEDFKTIAKHGEDADMVTIVNGTLSENSYYRQDGSLARDFVLRSPAFRVVSATAAEENQYVTSGRIVKMTDEVVDDTPTGAVIVDLLVIGFQNRGEVIQYVAESEEAAAFFRNTLSEGDEVKLAGRVIISEEVQTFKEEVAFGSPIINTNTKLVKKLVIDSASVAKTRAIDDSEVDTIGAEREGRLQAAKERSQNAKKAETKAPEKAAGRKFSL